MSRISCGSCMSMLASCGRQLECCDCPFASLLVGVFDLLGFFLVSMSSKKGWLVVSGMEREDLEKVVFVELGQKCCFEFIWQV